MQNTCSRRSQLDWKKVQTKQLVRSTNRKLHTVAADLIGPFECHSEKFLPNLASSSFRTLSMGSFRSNGYFFFQFQGVGRGGGSGGWWGTATDLSVASGVQELVAAVALETQLVPVLPQRRHLLSCT